MCNNKSNKVFQTIVQRCCFLCQYGLSHSIPERCKCPHCHCSHQHRVIYIIIYTVNMQSYRTWNHLTWAYSQWWCTQCVTTIQIPPGSPGDKGLTLLGMPLSLCQGLATSSNLIITIICPPSLPNAWFGSASELDFFLVIWWQWTQHLSHSLGGDGSNLCKIGFLCVVEEIIGLILNEK